MTNCKRLINSSWLNNTSVKRFCVTEYKMKMILAVVRVKISLITKIDVRKLADKL
jgi:hypothetical protein